METTARAYSAAMDMPPIRISAAAREMQRDLAESILERGGTTEDIIRDCGVPPRTARWWAQKWREDKTAAECVAAADRASRHGSATELAKAARVECLLKLIGLMRGESKQRTERQTVQLRAAVEILRASNALVVEEALAKAQQLEDRLVLAGILPPVGPPPSANGHAKPGLGDGAGI